MNKMVGNGEVGRGGENLACEYLIKNKYKILFRNYYVKFDEIDIIALAFDQTLVFVEVKTLRVRDGMELMPEDNLSKDKFKKLSRACRIFSGLHPEFIDMGRGWRIDLVAIALDDFCKIASLRHYENISA